MKFVVDNIFKFCPYTFTNHIKLHKKVVVLHIKLKRTKRRTICKQIFYPYIHPDPYESLSALSARIENVERSQFVTFPHFQSLLESMSFIEHQVPSNDSCFRQFTEINIYVGLCQPTSLYD